MDKLSKIILQTLSYSDIFDYPITKLQVWKYLHATDKNRITQFQVNNALNSLIADKKVVTDGTYYCLPKRKHLIVQRKEKEAVSKKKMEIAKNVANILSLIPSVLVIGVSGSVAMQNATKEDDIDFFIITHKNTVWITRLCIMLLLQIMGKRRKRQEKHARDKICVNMMIDETALSFSVNRHDFYTAHEIAQLQLLVSKKDMYNKFIRANTWVHNFLPNTSLQALRVNHQASSRKLFTLHLFPFTLLEPFAKRLQVWYIQKHQTTEIVTDHTLAFHPHDYRIAVQKAWEKVK